MASSETPQPYVRVAKPSEYAEATRVLTRAFAKDPAMNWYGNVREMVDDIDINAEVTQKGNIDRSKDVDYPATQVTSTDYPVFSIASNVCSRSQSRSLTFDSTLLSPNTAFSSRCSNRSRKSSQMFLNQMWNLPSCPLRFPLLRSMVHRARYQSRLQRSTCDRS